MASCVERLPPWSIPCPSRAEPPYPETVVTFVPNRVFSSLPTTIFEVMSALSREHQAVNLGQGFPDDPGPEDVRRAAAEAVLNGDNQYPPMPGLMSLREAVSAYYNQVQGLTIDPAQVIITCGATEALAAALLGLIEPGDKVLIFQPLYDLYAPMVRRAGGEPVFANLAAPDFRLTPDLINRHFSDELKLVIFNNPLNPSAVVHGEAELALLAEACIRHDVVAVCDEVWEEVVFDGPAFRPLMGFPGMAERTVKIGSAGKMFSLTGWKIGWTIAAAPLTAAIAKAHQFLTFTIAPPLQTAVAFGLNGLLTNKGRAEAEARRLSFQASRDHLSQGLRAEGFYITPSEGTYFLTIDLARSGVALTDQDFALLAVKQAGVATIPVSAFYDQAPQTGYLRLCFAKKPATLDAGIMRLAATRTLAVKRG